MTDLNALAERVLALPADPGTPEEYEARFAVDAAIHAACADYDCGDDELPAYTASLDAAITLVPEGYFWTAGRCGLTCHASVGPDNAHFDHDYLVAHQPIDVDIPNPSTPALALCAAALRARMEAGG